MKPVADFTIADHKVGTAKSLSTTSLNQPNQPNPVILTGSHRETEGSAVACPPITIGRVEWHLDWLSARSIRDDRGMHEVGYCTYIMASRSHTLYIGVTGNLLQRIFQHKWRAHNGFTARYNCDRLVWFERRSAPSRCLRWAGWILVPALAAWSLISHIDARCCRNTSRPEHPKDYARPTPQRIPQR
jgi:hypothetical protein